MTDDVGKAGCSGCEEASEEELLARLDEVIEMYKSKPGALIPVLQLAQGIFGYLPEVALKRIARGMKQALQRGGRGRRASTRSSRRSRGGAISSACAWGPPATCAAGCRCCEALKKELGIDVGETTEDREFSLEVARCFGACGLAPVLTINDVVHHRVKPARIREVLAQYAPEAVAVGAEERSA